jgi:hypothetical protein
MSLYYLFFIIYRLYNLFAGSNLVPLFNVLKKSLAIVATSWGLILPIVYDDKGEKLIVAITI